MKEISYILLESVKDPRVHGVTITGINLSDDLKRAKLFFSVIGNNEQIKKAKAGLDSAKGYIKREIGSRMSLRFVPEITFIYDPSLESGDHMERILEKLVIDESGNDTE
jgi:ribosome-binding factor A